MPKSKQLSIEIEPSVLQWLIESSGWTKEEISKRLNINLLSIENILIGEKKPTYRQLKELAIIFKRPIASFLLSKPIQEKPKPKDYRMLPNKIGKFDKKTIIVMRKTRRLQKLSKEMSRNIIFEPQLKLSKNKISDNPEQIAKEYRSIFKLTEQTQRTFKDPYQLFKYLRENLENMNIFVFQYSMPIEDARGFVFVDETPNVIVVNTKDIIQARIFTLMHEFAHILLGESVIDLPEATIRYDNNIEQWCNIFASTFLLPKEIAKISFDENRTTLTQRNTLKKLSNKFKVSKAMLLFNMKNLKYIEHKDYDAILKRYDAETKLEHEKKSGSGGIPSENRCLNEVGNKFVSLVSNNYDKNYITYTDALNYLSIKTKNFEKVLSKTKK